MKIAILGSMQFTDKMVEVKNQLTALGHTAFVTDFHQTLVGKTNAEIETIKLHQKYHLDAMREFFKVIQNMDAVLVLNFDKNGVKNYVGGNTLMEIGLAHFFNQKIFLWNPVPDLPYCKSEIEAVKPIIVNGDLTKIY